MTSAHLTGEPVPVTTEDGVTLAAHLHPAPAGVPLRGGLLLLPALAAPSRAMRALAGELAGRGWATMRADYRFHGESTPRPSRTHDASMADLFELDVPALLRVFRERVPGVPLACGGHSLGGQLSALSLAKRPDLVKAAVLITTSKVDESLWPGSRRLLPALAFRLMPAFGLTFGKLPEKPLGMGIEIPRTLIREWGHWGRTGTYETARVSLRGVLQGAEGPVLSIGASDDTLYSPRAALEAYLAMMPRARVTQWMLNPQELGVGELGHFGLLRPPATETVAARVVEWLGQVLGT